MSVNLKNLLYNLGRWLFSCTLRSAKGSKEAAASEGSCRTFRRAWPVRPLRDRKDRFVAEQNPHPRRLESVQHELRCRHIDSGVWNRKNKFQRPVGLHSADLLVGLAGWAAWKQSNGDRLGKKRRRDENPWKPTEEAGSSDPDQRRLLPQFRCAASVVKQKNFLRWVTKRIGRLFRW